MLDTVQGNDDIMTFNLILTTILEIEYYYHHLQVRKISLELNYFSKITKQ